MRQIKPLESHRQVARLVSELLKGQGTRIELVERTGLDRNYLSRLLAAMKEQKCIHIVGWDRDSLGRHHQAIFTLGFGEDAPRPPRQTQRERDAKRYRKAKEKRMAEKAAPLKTQFVGGSLWV